MGVTVSQWNSEDNTSVRQPNRMELVVLTLWLRLQSTFCLSGEQSRQAGPGRAGPGRARQEEQPVHFRAQRRDGGWRGWGHVRSGCFHNAAVLKKKKKRMWASPGRPHGPPPPPSVAFVQRCRLSFSLLTVVVASDLIASCRHIMSPLSLFSFNLNFLP